MNTYDYCRIVVEGDTDKAFLEGVLKSLCMDIHSDGLKDKLRIETTGEVKITGREPTGGWTALPQRLTAIAKDVVQKSRSRWLVLVIFDADDMEKDAKDGGYDKRFLALKDKCKDVPEFGPVDIRYFLFPNNHDDGDLEQVLSGMVKDEHKAIIESCWQGYVECVKAKRKRNGDPYNRPTEKSKMREYAAAIDSQVWEHQGYCKCFAKPDVWDYEAPVLKPLKAFLRLHLLSDAGDDH